MAKKINLSMTEKEAKMVYAALSREHIWRMNCAIRVSALRAPTQESLAEDVAAVQRRLAVKLEGK